MTHSFKEFSTSAIFNVGNETDLKSFHTPKQTELYTFIWAQKEAIEIIIDSIPFTIQPHSILALTPIQYLQYISGHDAIVYQFNDLITLISAFESEVWAQVKISFIVVL